MNIISKKSIMSLALVGLVVGSMPMTTHALLPDLTKKQALLVFVLGSFFWTACKEAVSKPTQVNLSADLKKLAQIQNIFTQDYWANVWHLIDDGYIGQTGVRGKAVLGITNEEDGSMAFKEVDARPSTGICGNILFVAKLVGKKIKDLDTVLAVPGAFIALWNMAEKVSAGEFNKSADKQKAPEPTSQESLNAIAKHLEKISNRLKKNKHGQEQAV